MRCPPMAPISFESFVFLYYEGGYVVDWKPLIEELREKGEALKCHLAHCPLPRPRWQWLRPRRPHPRITSPQAISVLRADLWAATLGLQNKNSFAARDRFATNPPLIQNNQQSAVLYASGLPNTRASPRDLGPLLFECRPSLKRKDLFLVLRRPACGGEDLPDRSNQSQA
jgi:hypothetical protein